MRFFFTLIIFISVFFTATASPGTYYNSIDTNQSCASLKTALFHLISSNYTPITYDQVKSAYARTDMHKSDDGLRDIIWDMYSDNPSGTEPYEYPFTTVYPSTILIEGMGLNREHVFPQSWFDYAIPANVDPIPKTDLYHVFPSDGYVNNQKSNNPIGKVNSTPNFISLNGSKVGFADTSIHFNPPYYSSTLKNKVFEPRDEYKGDFARAYLYMITRYEDSLPSWNSYPTNARDVLDGNKYPGFDSWILQLCVKWHKLDLPSTKERNRNDSVFAIQGNRNPYVDFPGWVEKVFGENGNAVCLPTLVKNNKTNLKFNVYPNPANNLINIQFENNTTMDKNVTIEVVDIMGQIILQRNIILKNEIEIIDVNQLSKGIYLVNIINDGQNNVTSFIKQ